MASALDELKSLQVQKLIQLTINRDLVGIDRLFTHCDLGLVDLIEARHGKTALIFSIENSDEDTFRYLIKIGANPAQPDCKNKTPLMYACENACHDMVELLCGLLNAESVNSVDCDLQSSLHYCMKMNSARHGRCTEVDRNASDL
jgi:hypothetical protein